MYIPSLKSQFPELLHLPQKIPYTFSCLFQLPLPCKIYRECSGQFFRPSSTGYNSSYLPGLYNQALPVSGLPMQHHLWKSRDPSPSQRIHILWKTTDLLNYEAFLPPLSEDPIKFKEELERVVVIHNSFTGTWIGH